MTSILSPSRVVGKSCQGTDRGSKEKPPSDISDLNITKRNLNLQQGLGKQVELSSQHALNRCPPSDSISAAHMFPSRSQIFLCGTYFDHPLKNYPISAQISMLCNGGTQSKCHVNLARNKIFFLELSKPAEHCTAFHFRSESFFHKLQSSVQLGLCLHRHPFDEF